MTVTKWFGYKEYFWFTDSSINWLIISFSINHLIFKNLQFRMKQWWFWFALSQPIKKFIILQLLLIYFNSAMNQSIIGYHSLPMCCMLSKYHLYTFTSELHRSLPIPSPCAALQHRWVPKVPWQCCALEDLLFIYSSWGGVLWMCLDLFNWGSFQYGDLTPAINSAQETRTG